MNFGEVEGKDRTWAILFSGLALFGLVWVIREDYGSEDILPKGWR